MNSIYQIDLLLKALYSSQENVAMWGAYQLLLLDNKTVESHLSQLLSSPFKDIQEAGITKVAELNSEKHLSEIITIFREEEGRLKYSAALTLSQFPNDFSTNLITKWFHQQLHNLQTNSLGFEASVYSFIKIDPDLNFPKVLEALKNLGTDNIKSSLVLNNLFSFCSNNEELRAVFGQYFVIRDLYSDADLTQRVIEQFGCAELIDWLLQNISKGYSVSSIYKQCYVLLGFATNQTDEACFTAIDQSLLNNDSSQFTIPSDFQALISALIHWVKQIRDGFSNPINENRLLVILESFRMNVKYLDRSIPKIIELETLFLLSIPLHLVLDQCLEKWLSQPTDSLEQIANYYNSSILLSYHREKILDLFYPNQPDWNEQQVMIVQNFSPLGATNSRNEVLWKFFRGELLGYDIPWPTIFPNPAYSKHLAAGLFLIYYHNFDYYIAKKDRIAIDYSLQLFNIFQRKEVIDLICLHFDALSLNHSELLYQSIEYLPDPKFLPYLMRKYRPEEYEIADRISVICETFCLETPEDIIEDLTKLTQINQSGLKQRIRLSCDQCNNTYRYSVNEIYVDEDAILKSNKLNPKDVWTKQYIQCKNCASVLPFKIDDVQLEEILLQSRVDRIIRTSPTPQNHRFRQKIVLIDFPKFQGKVYNPLEFENLVQEAEKESVYNPDLLYEMHILQIRMYRALQDWEHCHRVLKKIDPSPEFEIEWLFLLGFANYKLGAFAEARGFFKQVLEQISGLSDDDSNVVFGEQATYFCETLDSERSKRSRFKIIKGNK